ncbi:hypothetical protein GIB67_019544 [Kingdonia uniflora]|uniref:Uncharacterized protein n=1 Tax=Kingdonia uniflora TaxID=39325 RepID=A0A7J7N0N1_9MAGN|nr:hypothetical protein GIB67_019544 [Kingdonia uniflora]
MMEELCRELDDVKFAFEKLKSEHREKIEYSESLKKSHNEQVVRIKGAELLLEKQGCELNGKSEEIFSIKQMYEDLKSKFQVKESALRLLCASSDKLRADSNERTKKFEAENRELGVALDEANSKTRDQEKRICSLKDEIEGLRRLLSVSQKKCVEVEQKVKGSKELRRRDNLVGTLEDENAKIKDEFKWKKEQFRHLEEAHKKVQGEFRSSQMEWEKERSKLVDEICSLQTNLDSQMRLFESVQSQLQRCNQALSREESRRKLLEVQISESKTCYENACLEYQEAKCEIESLTGHRDQEISALRNLLSSKETLFKEMEFRRGDLEQENQELQKSLKVFQEAQIQDAGAASSLPKLRSKLRNLKKVHKDCSLNFKAREAEWNVQAEQMAGDLVGCRFKLDCANEKVNELEMELEECYSSLLQLKMENEETFVMLMVFKLGFSDMRSKLSNYEVEREEHLAILMEQFDQKNIALVKAHDEIERERNVPASLVKDGEYILLLVEVESYKEMLEESYAEQLVLKEQALKVEIVSSKLSNAKIKLEEQIVLLTEHLEQKNIHLVEARNEIERERDLYSKLSNSKVEVDEQVALLMEQLEQKNIHLVEARNEIERERLFCSELTMRWNEVEGQVAFLVEQLVLKNIDLVEAHNEMEREGDLCSTLSNSKVEVAEQVTLLMEQLEQKNIDLVEALNEIDRERVICSELSNSKDKVEKQVALLTKQLEQKSIDLVEARNENERERDVSTSLVKDEAYILVQIELEWYKKILEESYAEQLEVKEQALNIENGLKEDLTNVCDALDKTNYELAEKTDEVTEFAIELENWKHIAESLKSSLDENQRMRREMEDSLFAQIETEQALKQENESLICFLKEKDRIVMDLQLKIVTLVERDDNLSREIIGLEQEIMRVELEAAIVGHIEKENLLKDIGRYQDQISEFIREDTYLMRRLGMIEERTIEWENAWKMNLEENDELYDSDLENAKPHLLCSSTKRVDLNLDPRSPLKERNQ